MAELTVQEINQANGTEPTVNTGATAGDTYANNERTFLRILNTDVGTETVTVAVETSSVRVPSFGDVPVAAIVVGIGASEVRYLVAPRGSHGAKPSMTYTSSTAMGIEVMRLPRGL